MKRNEKMEKNVEKRKRNEEIWIHTKNPRRFPGFTVVVVVTVFVQVLADFHDYHPRWAQKLIFYIRTVKRNRNEIEAKKKSDFEHPTKKK